ncbi:MAG: beta-lactamase family protein [Betaproteobacteria bacterium]|nr:beta-lactamase family protein [Betaproteobacteria bacterium]
MRIARFVLPLLFSTGLAQAQDDIAARARAALEARVAAGTTVGIVAGIVHPDGRLEVVTAGRSGNDARPQLDALTLFEIGSITKTFTATLLAQRVARGELRLETTVREAAPALRDWKRPGVGDVTLGQLATHTSGLPRLPLDPWLFVGRAFTRDGPYGNYSSHRFLDFAAGSDPPKAGTHAFDYSNYGMALLGEILAGRENTTFDALVRRDILQPLGMARSGTSTSTGDAPLLARGHDGAMNRTGYWLIPGMAGAGALRSNVEEMAKYLVAQRDGLLPGARLTQERREKANGRSDIGLAWIIRPAGESRILWHNGGTGGFRTFAGWHEGTKTAVVVLSNSSIGIDEIGIHLLDPSVPLAAPEEPSPWRLAIMALVVTALPVMAWRAKLASRRDALWKALEIVATGLLLHLVAPWGFAGAWAWYAMVALGVAALALLAWRARPLPWPTPSRPTEAGRAIGRALTVVVFLACAVQL